MRQPTIALTNNLRFTRQGTVWADFLLTGLNYRYHSLRDKETVRRAHTMLARALPGQGLLLGLTADETPETIVQRMTADIDLDLHPDWVTECAATLDTVGAFRPGRRVYWLSVPLNSGSFKEKLITAGRALHLSASEMLGLPHSQIPDEELLRRADQARRIANHLPAMFEPVPTTPAQAVWLWNHMLRRGLVMDPDLPPAEMIVDDVAYPLDTAKSGGALAAARIDDGAQADRPSGRSALPSFSTLVKVDTPWERGEPPASYQVLSVVADTPAGGTRFPGSEFFTIADQAAVNGVPVDVDFALQIVTRAGTEVLRKNQRSLRNLNEQYNQREGELSTGQSILDVAAEALSEYSTLLESDKNEIEVAWTAIFATSGPDAQTAVESAEALATEFEARDFRIASPLGYQEDLWWSMVPGAEPKPIVREFTQITTSGKFGAYVPIVGAALGDTVGPLLALHITTPVPTAVHYDIAGLTERDVSNSIGITGELGAGKSKTCKICAGHIVDRGGQVILIDQSARREYGDIWASAVEGSVKVEMIDSEYLVDPLVLFPGQQGADQAETILRALMQLDQRDPRLLDLSEALSVNYRRDQNYDGMAGLLRHLLSADCKLQYGQEIGKRLEQHARRRYAKALFGEGLKPLPLDAPAIVFCTADVSLPTANQIDNAHLYERLPPEKQYGHVIYTHIAKLGQGICYADPSKMTGFIFDEAAHLLTAADGYETIIDIVKRGRKEKAGVILGDQDCEFGGAELRGLLKTRIAHRHTDDHLARKALDWIGLDSTDIDLVEEYTKHTAPIEGANKYVKPERRGEGYMRDATGKIGRIKVLEPAAEARRNATNTTTPGRHSASTPAIAGHP
ncbi:hypothetical protein GOEFS_119_00170 [Gordonia effusa NBRC 100432]|uniref:Uncharacterized protein n=1 Tax=Gordonia effusa NBRC 100432 TaxID=1077974 RepID=H0R626_9ACTN|nr:ATP-binding protein [Gordonia effusa]GAB20527.1 hypothetical protein GOEFS_119_00170 [Gordonia effusa NBRC 100432]